MGKNKGIYDYLLLTFGVILTAIAIVFLFNPNKLAAGGAQGIALVINHFTNLNIGLIMIGINLILFVAAFFVLGKGYGQKTLFSSLGLSLTVFLLERYVYTGPITENPMLAAIFGSALMGVGVGIILNKNASIGGTSLMG
ncbi:MAG: YitT family protein, partial [Clostridium sp.]|nr:YitT family protein [Clostridium sp.]